MDIRELNNDEILLFDGGIGTMLQKAGLKLGEQPEILNFTEENLIKEIHKEYIEAGSKVISTNTFGANELKLKNTGYTVEEVINKAVKIAKDATEDKEVYIALDLGPTGELLEPMGTLSFDNAYNIFKRQVIAGVEAGVDIIIIETITDLYEAKVAVLAAKENSNLPVFCTMSFEKNGRTFTGCTSGSMALTLDGLGVDALGVNCSLGPFEILKVIKEIKKYTNLPLMVQPNAGLPSLSFGETTFDINIDQYVDGMELLLNEGVKIVGGCCGTTPEYISKVKNLIDSKIFKKREKVSISAICSPSKIVNIKEVKVIGERINPTGKKLFKEALREGNLDYILKQGISQVDAGADILDVNVGLPDINEEEWMKKVVVNLQGILDIPLQIDSSDLKAIEAGLRYYNGKPILNSVNGNEEILESILPLVKKYGAAVVALTLDTKGIPKTAEERFKIAEKILCIAKEYGIKEEDIYIDALVLPISSEQESGKVTLETLRLIKERLGLSTVLGVSNISFGLPKREIINRTFLGLALEEGLTLPIINPNIEGMMETINAFKVLHNYDKDANKFIQIYGSNNNEENVVIKNESDYDLKTIIIKGLKEEVSNATELLLEKEEPLKIVNEHIVPALNLVGSEFEKGKVFLPQLISSAETVQKSFQLIKSKLLSNNEEKINNGRIILATVKGDIHDIGKNIVKVILESYGFEVIDLGKDVEPQIIVNTAKEEKISLKGLSALMTTTVKSMEDTIKLIKDSGLKSEVMVGGAVLTEDYSKSIGADYYAKDAMESVKIARSHFEKYNN